MSLQFDYLRPCWRSCENRDTFFWDGCWFSSCVALLPPEVRICCANLDAAFFGAAAAAAAAPALEKDETAVCVSCTTPEKMDPSSGRDGGRWIVSRTDRSPTRGISRISAPPKATVLVLEGAGASFNGFGRVPAIGDVLVGWNVEDSDVAGDLGLVFLKVSLSLGFFGLLLRKPLDQPLLCKVLELLRFVTF